MSVQEEVRADQWRKVHPLSPLLNGGAALTTFLGVVLFGNLQVLSEAAQYLDGKFSVGLVILIVSGAVVALILALLCFTYLQWRNTFYAVTDEAVHFRHGVIFKAHRRAPLDRVQSVDISRSLLSRVLGLAEIRVESAGGPGSSVKIQYLSVGKAEDVRREILHREEIQNEEVLEGEENAGSATEDSGIAHSGVIGAEYKGPNFQPWELYKLDLPIFLGGMVRSVGIIIAVVTILGFVVGAIVLVSILGASEFAIALGGIQFIISIVVAIAGIGSAVWGRVNSEYGFTAAVTSAGIRITRGLTKQISQTIPPGRIHAVRLQQPLLWRSKDWWRVSAVQAGVGQTAQAAKEASSEGGRGKVTMLPTGTRDQALRALWLVVRDLGIDDPDAFLEEALTGSGEGQYFTPVGRKVRLLDPLTYNRKSVFITDTVVAVRDGRITRTLDIIPHEHAQSVTAKQGPLERWLNVGNMRLDLVFNSTGMGEVKHLSEEVLSAAVMQQAELARLRRGEEPMEEWQKRMARSSA
ncbi:PH domain-containing protein [Winkia sp. UMB0889B]|uniref:PH domain-containing protein n=1 Tax=Winkia sp. UMB0889B TaxID=3046315 RepID=UPI00255267EC|nr:PH domain-containing protein [Winkia sp. UMB0889B]MDK7905510.1 PH domain-containing protein [Winkia sp. UMB0889B]